MLKIGITGGIGSGKSLVCKVFEQLGVPVFYADSESKKILTEDDSVRKAVEENFGKEVYKTDGTVDRKKLSELVFGNESRLNLLNSIVHPAVFKSFRVWCVAHSSPPYVIKEAAIMFESGADKELDKVITVFSPAELRIKRVMERDNISREEVEKRMKNQFSDEERIKRSSSVIYNDEEHMFIPQIIALHKEFSGK